MTEMVEIFKTNVHKKAQSKMLRDVLTEAFPSARINFDLADCDKVLRVECDVMDASRIAVLLRAYAFNCELLD